MTLGPAPGLNKTRAFRAAPAAGAHRAVEDHQALVEVVVLHGRVAVQLGQGVLAPAEPGREGLRERPRPATCTLTGSSSPVSQARGYFTDAGSQPLALAPLLLREGRGDPQGLSTEGQAVSRCRF